MASNFEYLDFVLNQLSSLEDLSYRPMMGEYVLYHDGKVVGGIYDDRFLLKETESALKILSGSGKEILREIPYEGARQMLAADIDDPELCCRLIRAIAEDLPAKKKRTGK